MKKVLVGAWRSVLNSFQAEKSQFFIRYPHYREQVPNFGERSFTFDLDFSLAFAIENRLQLATCCFDAKLQNDMRNTTANTFGNDFELVKKKFCQF